MTTPDDDMDAWRRATRRVRDEWLSENPFEDRTDNGEPYVGPTDNEWGRTAT
jgi:hypothetical protein